MCNLHKLYNRSVSILLNFNDVTWVIIFLIKFKQIFL